jgi:YidC/Oxa1 family membrane protein insertase
MISEFFNQFLYRPLLNILVILCLFLPGKDFGLAIIVLTVFLKSLLLPLTTKTLKNQKNIKKIQPKLKKIQKKYKDDEVKQVEELKKLYDKYEINPFTSLTPLLVQFPILIALYQVFLRDFNQENLYSFIPNIQEINYSFFGINLTNSSLILAIVAIVIYFFQLQFSLKNNKKKSMGVPQQFMPYFFSLITFMVLTRIPAAVSLYLATSSLFAIIQKNILQKNESK